MHLLYWTKTPLRLEHSENVLTAALPAFFTFSLSV